jgi:hypothetical protein
MTYGCASWGFAADTHLLKLQRLKNKALSSTGNFRRRTPTDSRFAHGFQSPEICDYITKLCRKQAEVIHNHETTNVRNVG